jgi:hypothetical protein
MESVTSHEANAVKCRKLAEHVADPSDRNRWIAMARFWLQPGKEVSCSDDEADAEIVK